MFVENMRRDFKTIRTLQDIGVGIVGQNQGNLNFRVAFKMLHYFLGIKSEPEAKIAIRFFKIRCFFQK